MGLVSLPILNKVQDYSYWNNLWDSTDIYKRYFYLVLFINKYFNLLFLDYTLNFINFFIKNLKNLKGYDYNLNLKKKIIQKFFIGKLWILKYQNWFLVIFNLFSVQTLKVFSLDRVSKLNSLLRRNKKSQHKNLLISRLRRSKQLEMERAYDNFETYDNLHYFLVKNANSINLNFLNYKYSI